jgi:hypothetical protein
MEVHPPHKPILSVKEFLVHLLAITIGLLIALGLEASVEWVHHRHQAQEAREDIHQEIRDNRQQIDVYLNDRSAEEKSLRHNLAIVNDALHGRSIKAFEEFKWADLEVQEASWDAASSSGVIVYLDHNEVKEYEKIYNGQRLVFSFLEEHRIDERMALYLYFQRVARGDKFSKAELESGKRIIEKMLIYDEDGSAHYLGLRYDKALAQVK